MGDLLRDEMAPMEMCRSDATGRSRTATPLLCRVLIVDDHSDLAEAMSKVLTIWGFQTATAETGRVALEKAQSFHPEVIVLDISLPDMDGYEVASALRGESELAAALFIAISAHDPDARARSAREAGFDHYLVKPVDLGVLLRILCSMTPRAIPLQGGDSRETAPALPESLPKSPPGLS